MYHTTHRHPMYAEAPNCSVTPGGDGDRHARDQDKTAAVCEENLHLNFLGRRNNRRALLQFLQTLPQRGVHVIVRPPGSVVRRVQVGRPVPARAPSGSVSPAHCCSKHDRILADALFLTGQRGRMYRRAGRERRRNGERCSAEAKNATHGRGVGVVATHAHTARRKMETKFTKGASYM